MGKRIVIIVLVVVIVLCCLCGIVFVTGPHGPNSHTPGIAGDVPNVTPQPTNAPITTPTPATGVYDKTIDGAYDSLTSFKADCSKASEFVSEAYVKFTDIDIHYIIRAEGLNRVQVYRLRGVEQLGSDQYINGVEIKTTLHDGTPGPTLRFANCSRNHNLGVIPVAE